MERTKRTISTSNWTVVVTTNRKEKKEVVKDILVVGNDVLKISKNPQFMYRVGKELFGKKVSDKELDRVKVIKIDLLKNLGESFSDDYD